MHKTRVAVLRGGPSEEYDVSLRTGSAVLNAIDRSLFTPIDVVITKNGEWLTDGYTRYPEHVLSTIDIAFLALHGSYGEDGTIQRLLDKFCVKYTGSKAYPSSIAIHKVVTKNHLKDLGILMSPHMSVSRHSLSEIDRISSTIGGMFGPQYVIKPVRSGSSVGTMMVKDSSLLAQALRDALSVYDEVIVERRIVGKEATCGVIENFRGQKIYALPPIEIVPPPKADFFNYEVKYDDSTQEICPGRFSRKEKDDIERISREVHETLGLSQYSRSDFMIGDDGVYFLEVNTLPGLTPASLFPKAIEAVGGTYQSFITHLLTDALHHS